jgi:thiamine transporter ThiT
MVVYQATQHQKLLLKKQTIIFAGTLSAAFIRFFSHFEEQIQFFANFPKGKCLLEIDVVVIK